jgi:hypothetical protein
MSLLFVNTADFDNGSTSSGTLAPPLGLVEKYANTGAHFSSRNAMPVSCRAQRAFST